MWPSLARLLPNGSPPPLPQPVQGCLSHPYVQSLDLLCLLVSQPSRKRKCLSSTSEAIDSLDDNDAPPRKKPFFLIDNERYHDTGDSNHGIDAQELGNDLDSQIDSALVESGCDTWDESEGVRDAQTKFGDAHRGNLCGLPVELVFAIGLFADIETLYNLTCLCHYVSDCITPLYLKKQGFVAPSNDSFPVTTISISTISQIEALQVWRRSSIFRIVTLAFIYLAAEKTEARVQARYLRSAFSSPKPLFARKLFIRLEGNTEENLVVLHSIKEFESVHIFTRDGQDMNAPLRFSAIGEAFHHGNAIPVLQLQNLEIRTSLLFTTYYVPWVSQALNSPYLHTVDLQKLDLQPFQWADLLQALHIPSVKSFFIAAEAPFQYLTAFLNRHPKVKILFIAETEEQSRLRCTTAIRHLYLPDLQELHAPIQFAHPLLNIIESPNLSMLSIVPGPQGLCPRALGRLLVHPACRPVTKLEIKLQDTLSSFIILDAGQVPSLPEIRHLSLTYGATFSAHCTMFTKEALEILSESIPLFTSLSCLHITDNSYQNQSNSAILARFAQTVRVAGNMKELAIMYNFENY